MKTPATIRYAVHAELKCRFRALVRRAIDEVDDVVFAREYVAYAHDDFGVHANPDAPRHLRFAVRVLSRLMRIRDGKAPCWDRRPGEQPRRYLRA
jgi:hypothetical protein